jgi:serine/threonine protein phosphatase 1
LNKRIIAIGDIHGCSAALKCLLDAISPTADDTIISLGDVVDRGPDSKAAVDLLLELRNQCDLALVQGNHEEMLLRVVKQATPPQEWLKHGGVSTLDSYGFAGDLTVIPQEHIDFFESALPYFETDDHFFTHGNYEPDVDFDEQNPTILRWRSLIESTPGPHKSGKKAVVGHTPDKSGEIFDIGYLVCIDTYCYGGAWLTALDVTNGTAWQANEEGELRHQ